MNNEADTHLLARETLDALIILPIVSKFTAENFTAVKPCKLQTLGCFRNLRLRAIKVPTLNTLSFVGLCFYEPIFVEWYFAKNTEYCHPKP